MRNPGYIYFIHAVGTRRYKIGFTKRPPKERLRELNSAQSPYYLKLRYVIRVDDVFTAEKFFHKKYHDNRKHGEWFEFSQWTAHFVICEMKKYSRRAKSSIIFFEFLLTLALMAIALNFCSDFQSRAPHKPSVVEQEK